VAFDLLFAEALARRLRRDAELGNFLIVARVSAEHLQAELGMPAGAAGVLAGDCLTGAWAQARTATIGEVPEGFYGLLIQTSRNTAGDLARIGPGIARNLDPFRPGQRAARDAAFQTGYRIGDPAACSAAEMLAASG
jgi:predicted metalloprotease